MVGDLQCSEADSLQVTLLSAGPAVAFPAALLQSVTAFRKFQFILFGEQRHMCERLA